MRNAQRSLLPYLAKYLQINEVTKPAKRQEMHVPTSWERVGTISYGRRGRKCTGKHTHDGHRKGLDEVVDLRDHFGCRIGAAGGSCTGIRHRDSPQAKRTGEGGKRGRFRRRVRRLEAW